MNRASLIIIAILAIFVGIYPSLYFLVDRKFGLLQSKTAALLNDPWWNAAFYTHIILSGIALLVGWIQFSKKVRMRKPKVHRTIGKIYVVTAMTGALAGIYISFFATGGIIPALGFAMLGLVWFATTLKAFTDATHGRYEAHRKMMIFSYAACFAAVTLRIYLPILSPIMGFVPAYKIIAWLCWLPNMLVAGLIARDPKKVYSVAGTGI